MAPTKKLSERLYTGDFAFEFVKHRRRWYILSAVILTICLLALAVRGLNMGIEFTGGASFQAPTQVSADTVDRARTALANSGVEALSDANVVTIGDQTVRAQTRSLTTEEVSKVREALAAEFGSTKEQIAYSSVGKSWGDQITQKGLQALIIFMTLVALMIWAYFRDWKMSVAALVALVHDLIVTVGVYAIVGFTVTPASLIGVLTILGYSLYDTVVVFDKVRENVAGLANTGRSYSEAANHAVNQVLIRSLNTTIIGVLPVAALLIAGAFVLGQGPLEDLGLALLVGMVAGAYSSIFIATPLLAQMREREPDMQALARAAARRHGKRAVSATVAGTPVTVASADDEDLAPVDLPVGVTDEDGEVVQTPRVQPRKTSRRGRGR
ncbi:protein translocase subunit SecF [Aestuariimicrobium ganziense]|uniref:protein translocase subunit SecF n=1 Tax=Aestuariimicrobium ganziense TaxID=2773677 RepID=UPI001944EA32|nr:protein translocase subunit SecF [Aestuariimicrobium ganziense]